MSGVLKKVYHGVALVALLNLAVVGGSIGYLAATGRLTVERVERAADALRGEWPEEPEAQPEAEAAAPLGSADTLYRDQGEEEVVRLRADRRRAELQQQVSTIAAARLEVTRQREALERRYDEMRSQAKQREQQEESEGFKKELDLLSSVKPKVAVGYLLEKPREDAAALLLAMETRKGKRLVEAAKTVSQRRAMADVLEMLREMSPEQADLLNQSQR
jgi:hypothetical protein